MRAEWVALLLVSLAIGCAPVPGKPRVTAPDPEPSVASKPDPNEVQAISYDDLDLPMKPDTLFEAALLTQRARDLDGKRVRIRGFMGAGSIFTTRNVKSFVMLREKECPYGPGGHAHHAIAVDLTGVVAQFTVEPITVEGILTVRPFTGENGKTWSVFHLAGTKLE